jgi:hypothetical protein
MLRIRTMETSMPRGDKSSYTDKQKRQAEHIEEGYENRGVPEGEAERRAWATVNKETHGGKKSGSGRSTKEDHSPSRKAGPLGRGRRGQASGFGTFAVGQEGRPNQKTQRLNRYRESARSVEAV